MTPNRYIFEEYNLFGSRASIPNFVEDNLFDSPSSTRDVDLRHNFVETWIFVNEEK